MHLLTKLTVSHDQCLSSVILYALPSAPAGASAVGAGKTKVLTFTTCPFATSLAAELAKGPIAVGPGVMATGGGGIVISDGPQEAGNAPKPDAACDADEEFARRMQAKIDAESR